MRLSIFLENTTHIRNNHISFRIKLSGTRVLNFTCNTGLIFQALRRGITLLRQFFRSSLEKYKGEIERIWMLISKLRDVSSCFLFFMFSLLIFERKTNGKCLLLLLLLCICCCSCRCCY